MNKYTYKDSGIEWLGKIPEHWEITKIKKEFKVQPSNVNKKAKEDEEDVLLCNYVDVYYNDYITNGIDFMDTATASENEIKKFQIEIGDVIITKDSEDPLDIAVPALVKETQERLLCGYHLSMIRSIRNKIDGAFLFWSLNNEFIASQLFREATGVTRWAIASRHVKNSSFAFPPLEEQKAIAEYLDKATARIDRIIAIKQEQLVKMEASLGKKINEIIKRGVKDFELKESRKDFIGKIPKHYKVQKLKHITTKITDGAHFTPNYLDIPDKNSVPFLRVTDVQVEKIDLNKTKYIDIEEHNELIKRCNPEKGDLLLSKNGTIGVTKVVDWDWAFSIFVSLCLIKPDRQLNINYLNYFFKSEIMDFQIKNSSKQITVTNLHLEKIRDFYIVTPPICEQEQIVKRLKDIELKFNFSLKNIKSQIETLQAYRKSLIHECVTGKKQVTSAIKNQAYA